MTCGSSLRENANYTSEQYYLSPSPLPLGPHGTSIGPNSDKGDKEIKETFADSEYTCK